MHTQPVLRNARDRKEHHDTHIFFFCREMSVFDGILDLTAVEYQVIFSKIREITQGSLGGSDRIRVTRPGP